MKQRDHTRLAAVWVQAATADWANLLAGEEWLESSNFRAHAFTFLRRQEDPSGTGFPQEPVSSELQRRAEHVVEAAFIKWLVKNRLTNEEKMALIEEFQ